MNKLPYFRVHGALDIAFWLTMFLAYGIPGVLIAFAISWAWQWRFDKHMEAWQQDIVDECDARAAVRATLEEEEARIIQRNSEIEDAQLAAFHEQRWDGRFEPCQDFDIEPGQEI